MVVVDRMNKEILNMPAKGGELHSEVHPGLGDPGYFIIFVFDYSEEGVR